MQIFKCTQLKILLLKLGIKEVVWQKIVTNTNISLKTGKNYCMS